MPRRSAKRPTAPSISLNFALNARDAMRSGGELTIETFDVVLSESGYEQVSIEIPPGAYVVLRVSDSGHGMTPEVKSRLFEPFFTTKSAERNTGLGLATVYGIVAQSSGYISVDSEVGCGAVFTVYLPYAILDDQPAGGAAPPETLVGGSETILLVEDEEAVRTLARRVLVNQGYTVLEAANGREALTLVSELDVSPDLILTDVVMPELGGQELVTQVLDHYPAIRVVYMSGYSDTDKLLPTVPDPTYSFLQKPFAPENLTLTVREALDREVQLVR